MIQPFPTRDEVLATMQSVIGGDTSREEAAQWASLWVNHEHDPVTDLVLWKALIQLCGVDLKDSPTSYLHSESDVDGWMSALSHARER